MDDPPEPRAAHRKMDTDERDPPLTLIEFVAQGAIRRMVARTVRKLQALRGDNLLSGTGEGLRDVWDEICVQVQDDYSPAWPLYEDLLEQVIRRLLPGLARGELHAIWSLSRAGEQWLDDPDVPPTSLPWEEDGIVEVIRQETLNTAADWSNSRIRKGLERD